MIFHLTCKRLRQCRVDRFKYNPEIFLFLFYTNLFNIMGETALYNKYLTKYHKINIKPLKLSKAVIQNLFKWLISFSWAAHLRTWVSFIWFSEGITGCRSITTSLVMLCPMWIALQFLHAPHNCLKSISDWDFTDNIIVFFFTIKYWKYYINCDMIEKFICFFNSLLMIRKVSQKGNFFVTC